MENSINIYQESQETLRFLQNPSHENFSMVVDEHIEMVRKITYRLVMNEHDADDITQETFISAYQNIGKFQRKAKFKTWLCKIAHNKAYTFLRNKDNNIADIIEIDNLASGSNSLHPEHMMKSLEAHDKIHNAIAELPEHLRSVILLISIDETPIDEAVYILECNKATIYWRLHKARKILKEKLEI